MELHNYSSHLLEKAVNEFAKLPGIGKKTALRLVLHLLNQDEADVSNFGESIIQLKKEIKHCKKCNNISDTEICNICTNPNRAGNIICVVESIRDVMAIENTHQFNGLYHVLGGIISPMDGIGPNDLSIDLLEKSILENKIEEIIFALPTTMEGDTTNFYLFKKLNKYEVTFSVIARGVAIGDELEYIDEITLGRSIVARSVYENTLSQ
ncbi:MAG: recombination protein RecR [Chlorobi bacterium]|nr:recombination protein RecR [Chlorobiota bacterium]